MPFLNPCVRYRRLIRTIVRRPVSSEYIRCHWLVWSYADTHYNVSSVSVQSAVIDRLCVIRQSQCGHTHYLQMASVFIEYCLNLRMLPIFRFLESKRAFNCFLVNKNFIVQISSFREKLIIIAMMSTLPNNSRLFGHLVSFMAHNEVWALKF